MSQIDLRELGLAIKEARKAKGLTQAEIAERIGSSRQRILAFELGYNPDMSFATVLRLLNAVDLDLRVTTFNDGRPTLDDLHREQDEEERTQRGMPRPRW